MNLKINGELENYKQLLRKNSKIITDQDNKEYKLIKKIAVQKI